MYIPLYECVCICVQQKQTNVSMYVCVYLCFAASTRRDCNKKNVSMVYTHIQCCKK